MMSKISLLAISILTIFLLLQGCAVAAPEVRGELKKWHTITLVFEGPETSELAEDNPFLNYRLDVIFIHDQDTFVVPGFYAADGQAAETSAEGGNIWIVRFTPNHVGQWNYRVSFQKGQNVAVEEDSGQGESAGFMDGLEGSLQIDAADKSGIDNRANGRLQYVGEPYLKYAETSQYFIKVGVDAPENLLAYEDIDATPNVFGLRKNWSPHEKDFQDQAEQFLWQGNKGRNLLGALHYLASEKLNVFSFLTFNVDGDDRNIIPHRLKVATEEYEKYAGVKDHRGAWDSLFHKTRFDISKLEQWERIFSYAETQGMFLHFKTHETETDHLMDGGIFGVEGKLYYRELIARFGHHLALNWNLGEENNQPIEEVIKAANYIHRLDPYKHHMVIHTFPNDDDRYGQLIGEQSPLTGASLQLSDPEFWDVHPRVLKWRSKSDATGKRWVLAVDEPGKAQTALLPDDEDREHHLARGNALWGTLMAGGCGVEWYFGYASPHSDLTCQDFRSRDLFWDQNRHARIFFEEHLPFWDMEPADELTSDSLVFCLAKRDEVYALYCSMGRTPVELDMGDSGSDFRVQWYDPRNGGALQGGSVTSVSGTGKVSLGVPPNVPEKDWVILVTRD